MSYADASTELDEIVAFFEQRDLDVDQLVGRLVRATEIVEELDRRLRGTRLQVEQLVPRLTEIVAGEMTGAGGPSGTLEGTATDPASAPASDSAARRAGSSRAGSRGAAGPPDPGDPAGTDAREPGTALF